MRIVQRLWATGLNAVLTDGVVDIGPSTMWYKNHSFLKWYYFVSSNEPRLDHCGLSISAPKNNGNY